MLGIDPISSLHGRSIIAFHNKIAEKCITCPDFGLDEYGHTVCVYKGQIFLIGEWPESNFRSSPICRY